mgnify:FL=1
MTTDRRQKSVIRVTRDRYTFRTNSSGGNDIVGSVLQQWSKDRPLQDAAENVHSESTLVRGKIISLIPILRFATIRDRKCAQTTCPKHQEDRLVDTYYVTTDRGSQTYGVKYRKARTHNFSSLAKPSASSQPHPGGPRFHTPKPPRSLPPTRVCLRERRRLETWKN